MPLRLRIEHLFDMVRRWTGPVPGCRGVSWRAASPTVRSIRCPVRHRRPPRGPGPWGRRPAQRREAGCPTPSCTATPTSASWTGPRRQTSWWPRPSAWGSPPWHSPTTTASTGWCGSPRRPGNTACRPCSAASCRWTHQLPVPPSVTHRPPTCWCWPRTRPAMPGWAPPYQRPNWPEARDTPDSPWIGSPTWPERIPTGRSSPGAGRAPFRQPSSAMVRRRQDGPWTTWWNGSAANGWWWSSGTTGTRWTPSVTTPWPASPWAPAWAWWPPTTSTTTARPVAAWPPPWPRCGPAGRWTNWMAGFRPPGRPTCAPGWSRPDGSPDGRRPCPQRPSWVGGVHSTSAWWPPACRPTRVPTGWTRWPSCVGWPPTGPPTATEGAPPNASWGHGPRSTGSWTSSPHSDSPGTSSWCGTSWSSAGGRGSSARDGDRRPTRRSATRWASPTPTLWAWACCSSGSSPRSGTGRPTSTWTSRAVAGRRSSSTCTAATAVGTPPRWPTSSPTGPARRCATRPGHWGTTRVSRTPSPRAWSVGCRPTGRRPTAGRPPAVERFRPGSRPTWPPWPTSCATPPGTSASTPVAWSSATGRWPRCARWSGGAWLTAASCSGTRRTVPRLGWSSSTCWAWACSAPCTTPWTWWPPTREPRSTWHAWTRTRPSTT